MIKEFRDKRYKFEEQLALYKKHRNELSHDLKFSLVNKLVSDNIFAYLEVISKIVFDIADTSDNYLRLLEAITEKIKHDLAKGPFLKSLEEIGEKKGKKAIELYNKIIEESNNDTLVVFSGLILGGYAKKHEDELTKLLKGNVNNLILSSYLEAILVAYRTKELSKEIYTFLDKIERSKEEKLLIKLANISLALYKKNEKYFYNKILNLVKLKNDSINSLIFSKLSYLKIINKEHRFALIKISKDSNKYVIDEILQILIKHPRDYKKVSNLLIYWLNKDLKFELRYFDWVLEELSKKNKLFIDYFLNNFRSIKNGTFVLPYLFATLSKYHVPHSLKRVAQLDIKNKDEEYLFYELNRKIIGNIYHDMEYFSDIVALISNLEKITQNRDFVSFNERKFKEKSKNKTQANYDYLINLAHEILDQLQYRKEKYNFPLIRKNIRKYPNLYNLAKVAIDDCELNKKFSPLLQLGETEKPDLGIIKISETDDKFTKAIKLSYARDRYWSRAYLRELNYIIPLLNRYPNGKFKKEDLYKQIVKKLSDEKVFWKFFSEIIFIKKFTIDKNIIKEIEPKVPYRNKKNLDLKINLLGRDIYFEITQPELDRSLKLANGAVKLKNKAFSVIHKKYRRQIISDGLWQEIKDGKRSDLFFIVIDISSSIIDEHELLDSFLGSLAYNVKLDKGTGRIVNQFATRKKDSLSDRDKRVEVISGAIYFKKELTFIDKNPKIVLKGDIIQNPNAINKISADEIDKLKILIFD